MAGKARATGEKESKGEEGRHIRSRRGLKAMMTKGRYEAQRRWARWFPKKFDDRIIELWAESCSRVHSDCRGCEFMEDCQDLADRLIGSMNAPLKSGRRQTIRPESRQQSGCGM